MERMEKILLRLPSGMRQEIQASAATNRRSMNAEITYRLDVAKLTSSRSEQIAVTDDDGN